MNVEFRDDKIGYFFRRMLSYRFNLLGATLLLNYYPPQN
jgi:hypothetical protein